MQDSIWEGLKEAWADAIGIVTNPQERAYWLFLVGALVVAGAVLSWRHRSLATAARAVFARALWWHPSARMDYRLIALNAVVKALLLAPLVLSAFGVAVAVVGWLTRAFGEPAPSSLSRLQITAVYTVVLFVAWDLSRFVVHLLLHRVSALWEFHKVHHSAEVLTPLSVYRVHPVESLLFAIRGALVTGVVTGVFFYMFRDRAIQYELFGVNAIGVLFSMFGANLRHSHVWISYGRVVERIFISPAQHQLHHSVDPYDYDCNYGSFLAVWDVLLGSLRLARRRPRKLGLADCDKNHDPHGAVSALVGPVVALYRRGIAFARKHALRPHSLEKKHETRAS